jgi:microsomal dipeptidase-like Zn-dependent dipeptidase
MINAIGFDKIVLFIVLGLLTGCATTFDRALNRTTIKPPYKVSPNAEKLHRQLVVIDLHADPLLWKRDLLKRARHGHVDLPRLQEGNVSLQVFGVVTGVSLPLRMEGNVDRHDVISLLAKLQRHPEAVQLSRMQRALFQANKLRIASKSSDGQFMLIRTRKDLSTLLKKRRRGRKVIGAMLSLEGLHALEGDTKNLDKLYQAGFRILGLAHLFDNDMAGSAHGKFKQGLTAKGRKVVKRAIRLGMIIDLAHASEKTFDDVIKMTRGPVISSHGGVRGTCDTARNLSDKQIKAIAKSDGVIGIGLYKYAVCGKTMDDTVRAMLHVKKLVGVRYIALGTDFDGATETHIDASGMKLLTEALLKAKFTKKEIRAIMGGNALRLFRRTLPRN